MVENPRPTCDTEKATPSQYAHGEAVTTAQQCKASRTCLCVYAKHTHTHTHAWHTHATTDLPQPYSAIWLRFFPAADSRGCVHEHGYWAVTAHIYTQAAIIP